MMLLEKAAAYHLSALCSMKRSEATVRQVNYIHRSFLRYVERHKLSPTTESLSLEGARNYLADLGARCEVNTVASHTIVLRTWAGLLASDMGFFGGTNPLVGLHTPRKSQKVPYVLSRQEFDRMVAMCTQTLHPLRNAAILKLLVESGLRNSELCELLLADVEFATSSTAGRVLVRNGKGRKQRYVGFGLEASRALVAYIERERPKLVRAHPDAPWLFVSRTGEQIGDRGLFQLVCDARDAAGLSREIHVHTFRHTFATWRAKAGINAFKLQAQLGHASSEMTNLYVHLADQDIQDTYMSMLDAAKPQIRPLGRHCSTCTCRAPAERQAS